MSGEANMKSAALRLQATGTFQTTSHGQERLDVGVTRLGLKRIPEKNQQIELTLRDHGSDLLVTTKRAAKQLAYCESELRFQQRACGPSRKQVASPTDAAVESRPLEQAVLLVVMRDHRDPQSAALSSRAATDAARRLQRTGPVTLEVLDEGVDVDRILLLIGSFPRHSDRCRAVGEEAVLSDDEDIIQARGCARSCISRWPNVLRTLWS